LGGDLSGDDSRFLEEARARISSGSTIFSLFLLASLVWWVANFFPFDLSERPSRALSARLEERAEKAAETAEACYKEIENYCDTRSGFSRTPRRIARKPEDKQAVGSVLTCLGFDQGHRANIVEKNDTEKDQESKKTCTEIRRRRSNSEASRFVEQELDRVVQGGKCDKSTFSVFSTWRDTVVSSCQRKRQDLHAFVDDWTKEGSIEVIGLKISNIDVKWYPLALAVIFAAGGVWLGFLRRRVISLLDAQFQLAEQTGTRSGEGLELKPALLSAPWWLWPLPDWRYASGRSFRDSTISPPGYRRMSAAAAAVLAVVAVMLAGALFAQNTLSMAHGSMTPELLGFADLAGPTGLTGNAFLDMLIVAILPISVVGLLGWLLPLRQRRAIESGPAQSRRDTLKWLLGSVGIVLGSAAAPALINPSSILPLFKLRLVNNPYFHKRKKTPHTYLIAPGWYWRKGRKGNTIGHFAKPVHARRDLGIVPGAVVMEGGSVINGTFISTRNLSPMREPPPALPPSTQPSAVVVSGQSNPPPQKQRLKRLDLAHYSEGIETQALMHWRHGRRDAALDVLELGLSYVANGSSAQCNLRLCDLLAGLLVRSGKDAARAALWAQLITLVEREIGATVRNLHYLGSDLNDLRNPPIRHGAVDAVSTVEADARDGSLSPRTPKEKQERAQQKRQRKDARLARQIKYEFAKIEMLRQRLTNWSESDGKWRKKWRAPSLRWNGLDI